MRTTTVIATLPLLLPLAMASNAAATDVPRGGADIAIGPGGKNQLITLKNTTGTQAKDVTLTVYGVDNNPPKIVGIDVVGQPGDKVDDNDDGALDGTENDQTDGSPDTTCRSIFDGFSVNNNGTISVTVDFDKNLPAGAKLKVRFSTEIGNKHYDLCSAGGLGPFGQELDLPIGTHLGNYLVVNELPNPVPALYLITPIDPPPVAAFLSPPFQTANVQFGLDVVTIQLPAPLLPGASIEVNVEFATPAPVTDSLLLVAGPALRNAGVPYGFGCPGDGGFVPELHVAGVPSAGSPITLWIDEGLGGAPCFLFVGTNAIQVPFGGGCDLLVNPLISPLLPLSPGGPGAGSLALPVLMPPASPPGLTLSLQAIVVDPSTPTGLSASNGVTMILH